MAVSFSGLVFLIVGLAEVLQLLSQPRESQLVVSRVWVRSVPIPARIIVLWF